MLVGGITVREFKKKYLSLFLPHYSIFEKLEARFTDVLISNLDIIDKEKVIFKVSNPVDPVDILAMIYLLTFWYYGSEIN